MKAAALAFVLLIGAAIVLAFANTLNSWVLGGLIGGLAALLLSIPISLALFTVMARRHDEQLVVQGREQEEEMVLYDDDEYAEVYEADAYVLPSEENQYIEPRRLPEVRNVPAPSYPRLPTAGQSHAQAATNGMYNQRSLNYPQGTQRPSQSLSAQENGTRMPGQRLTATGSLPYIGNQSNALAKHRTAALRAARLEAAQELNSEMDDDIPTTTSMSRRLTARPSQPLKVRPSAGGVPRPTRQLSQQEISSTRTRRPVDANSTQQTSPRRYQPIDDDTINRYPRTDSLRMRETETDRLHGRLEQTEPLRKNPETGKITRNPKMGEHLRNPDTITGSLKNPLVRRPPYMYEDDPLRDELAQLIERPIVRRSSLRESLEEEQEN
jgi:hypothetical protein